MFLALAGVARSGTSVPQVAARKQTEPCWWARSEHHNDDDGRREALAARLEAYRLAKPEVVNEAAKRMKAGKSPNPMSESDIGSKQGTARDITANKVGIGRETGEHYLWLHDQWPDLAAQVLAGNFTVDAAYKLGSTQRAAFDQIQAESPALADEVLHGRAKADSPSTDSVQGLSGETGRSDKLTAKKVGIGRDTGLPSPKSPTRRRNGKKPI